MIMKADPTIAGDADHQSERPRERSNDMKELEEQSQAEDRGLLHCLGRCGLTVGQEVIAFDPRDYVDDIETPNCHRPATIVKLYPCGEPYPQEWLADLRWDHDGRITGRHFAWGIKTRRTLK